MDLLLVILIVVGFGVLFERCTRPAIIAIEKPIDTSEDEDEAEAAYIRNSFRAAGMRMPVVIFTRGTNVTLLH